MPIDDLFYSLADDQHANAIGVSLSGSGSDGALGMQAIKGEGGITFAGRSTGEEVYSIAMCLMEFLNERHTARKIQIFGTDVSESALATARLGVYFDSIANDVSETRLQRFFSKTNGHYQICKSVRNLCIFANHNVTCDPPFSQLNLISCRNVLIYFDPVLQKRVISLFHYALKAGGSLVLGPSETIGSSSDIFSLMHDKKYGTGAADGAAGRDERCHSRCGAGGDSDLAKSHG